MKMKNKKSQVEHIGNKVWANVTASVWHHIFDLIWRSIRDKSIQRPIRYQIRSIRDEIE